MASMATTDTYVDGDAYVKLPVKGTDSAITLTTWNADNPTDGNGTLRAIITYTLRTFGA